MKNANIPGLSEQDLNDGLLRAAGSARRRHAKVLHQPGDAFNQVFNFILQDSYMQPHLHPGVEKIEKIYLIQGKLAVIFFDDRGAVKSCVVLAEGGAEAVEIPAFAWHTYVMLSESAVSYETMMGVYEPKTWKQYADWAPPENSNESPAYLKYLKEEAEKATARR